MDHDVFISYASEDEVTANAVCSFLEQRKVRCWIAPRDAIPGPPFAGQITRAIENSTLLILIFSAHSNSSSNVLNEVQLARSANHHVIAFRLEKVLARDDLKYHLTAPHWLDALTRPLEPHLHKLANAVEALLRLDQPEKPPTEEPTEPAKPAPRRTPFARWAVALATVAVGIFAVIKYRSPAEWHLTRQSPTTNALIVGPPLIYKWEGQPELPPGSDFEIRRRVGNNPAKTKRLQQSSFSEYELSGPIEWSVRALPRLPSGQHGEGKWALDQHVTFYPNALEKILAKQELVVGYAESTRDGVFIAESDDGKQQWTGFEVEILQKVFDAMLHKRGLEKPIAIRWIYRDWKGFTFATILDESRDVDLLASGISQKAEREKKYHLKFSTRTVETWQTIVAPPDLPVFANGKFAIPILGVPGGTTSEELARQLVGNDVARLIAYHGEHMYDTMMGHLKTGEISGVLMDKPYARQMIRNFPTVPPWAQRDITSDDLPGLEAEHIAFALRATDKELLEALNAGLKEQADFIGELRKKYFGP